MISAGPVKLTQHQMVVARIYSDRTKVWRHKVPADIQTVIKRYYQS